MKKTVSSGEAVVASEAVLPPRVQEALGELVGVAREGLLALSVGVGLGVLAELMEEEVVGVVGPKGRHDAAVPSTANSLFGYSKRNTPSMMSAWVRELARRSILM